MYVCDKIKSKGMRNEEFKIKSCLIKHAQFNAVYAVLVRTSTSNDSSLGNYMLRNLVGCG